MSKLKIIRGARIEQQLHIIEEASTLADLERNVRNFTPVSTRRQNATDTIRIVEFKLIPTNKTLTISALSNSESGKSYEPVIFFQDVEYVSAETPEAVRFMGSDSTEHFIKPIKLSQHVVKVRCTCLDFYHRFAVHNLQDGSLHGSPPAPYQKKPGSNRGPVNPKKVPGVCKHLLKLVQASKDAKIIV